MRNLSRVLLAVLSVPGLFWVVTDNQGVTQGVGSRFFRVQNP